MNYNNPLPRSPSWMTINLSDMLSTHNVFVSISCDSVGLSSVSPLTISASASPIPLSSSLFPASTNTLMMRSCSEASSPETTKDGFSDEGTLDSYATDMDMDMDIDSGDESAHIPMDIDETPMDTQQPVMFRKKSSTGHKGGKRPSKSPKSRSLLSR